MSDVVILYDNFKKYKPNTIVMGVPSERYFRGGEIHRHKGKKFDVIIEEGNIGFMLSSDKMKFYNTFSPDAIKVRWFNNNVIGGEAVE